MTLINLSNDLEQLNIRKYRNVIISIIIIQQSKKENT